MSPIRLVAVLALLLLAILGWFAYRLTSAPDLAAYVDRQMPPAPASPGRVSATFLGVTTVLFDDGETAILTDGFFSRPGPLKLLTKVEPAREVIAAHLHHAGITKLAAVIVSHSNYDHVMDAPEIARVTGATLIGSESTANVGRGWGLPENQIYVPKPGEVMRFGQFQVRLLPSAHVPGGRWAIGEIKSPLHPPAAVSDYRDGGTYALVIGHGGRTMVVNASAGFMPGALKDVRADVVFLGIGTLGRESSDYQENYWREVVAAIQARRVIPVHWDNFTIPLDRPMVPLPRQFDDLDVTMAFLTRHGARDNVDIRLPVVWQPFDPFIGLAPRD
ncbi:MAG: MBL fold metallo-hydrolase [Ferrovibrionaceae bacterium]